MKQIAFAGAVMLVLSGCRAPMPSFDLLAPYGKSCVPPPGTGTIGTGGTYYSPPANSTTNPPVGTGFRPATISKPVNKWSSLGDSPESNAAGDVAASSTRSEPPQARVVNLDDIDVALARQQPTSPVLAASRVIEHRGPVRIVQPSSAAAGNGNVLRGLPLNGTSVSRAPRTFVPSGRVADITDAPQASSVRTVPAPTRAGNTQASSTVASDGWQSRT